MELLKQKGGQLACTLPQINGLVGQIVVLLLICWGRWRCPEGNLGSGFRIRAQNGLKANRLGQRDNFCQINTFGPKYHTNGFLRVAHSFNQICAVLAALLNDERIIKIEKEVFK
jgi:hypothetical protein